MLRQSMAAPSVWDVASATHVQILATFAAFGMALLWLSRRPPRGQKAAAPPALAKLVGRDQISHNTTLLHFVMPGCDCPVPPGMHMQLAAPNCPGASHGLWNGRADPESGKPLAWRKYTPVHSKGRHFDLLVKNYPSCPGYPDGGKVSQHLHTLVPGQCVWARGPCGRHQYIGKGTLRCGSRCLSSQHLAFVAGGTGITPLLAIAEDSLSRPAAGEPALHMLCCNQTDADVLLGGRLAALQERHGKHRLKVWHCLSRQQSGTTNNFTGRVRESVLRQVLPEPGLSPLILICGPAQMNAACLQALDSLGYGPEMRIFF